MIVDRRKAHPSPAPVEFNVLVALFVSSVKESRPNSSRFLRHFALNTRANSSVQMGVSTLNVNWGANRKPDIGGGNRRCIGKLRYPFFP